MLPNGAFVQQTPIFNFNDSNVNSVEFQDFMTQLTQTVNNMSLILNMKDTGTYDTEEFICGQVYFPLVDPTGVQVPQWRPIYRKIINFGAVTGGLPNAGCFSAPHGIPVTNTWFFTRQYAEARNPAIPGFLAIPYVSSVDKAHDIELSVDSVSVRICNVANYSAYTTVYVILEYCESA